MSSQNVQRISAEPTFSNPVIRWLDYRLPIFTFLHHELNAYPTPRNLNYLWNFGSLAGMALIIMIASGIVLAMHYVPTGEGAFKSVEHIMRDVNYGWLIRYIHTTGASMFFAVVYIHIFRGLYYGSFRAPRELLWWLGVIILLLMMATAFFGYTLPWGQMSFWGATVITNLFSAIPLVGDSIDMVMGRVHSGRSHAQSLLCVALLFAVHNRCGSGPAPRRVAPFRLKQSYGHRHERRGRHDPISSLLHGEGSAWASRAPSGLQLVRL